MNWRLVLLLSLLGIAMTVPAVLGWLTESWMEYGAWAVVAVFTALVLAARGSGNFRHGFMAGALMGVWQHLLVFLLWDMYIQHNPEFAATLAEDNPFKGIDPRYGMLIAMPVISIMYGLLTGLLAWLAGRMVRGKPLPLEP
jgi:hypothetical protein